MKVNACTTSMFSDQGDDVRKAMPMYEMSMTFAWKRTSDKRSRQRYMRILTASERILRLFSFSEYHSTVMRMREPNVRKYSPL